MTITREHIKRGLPLAASLALSLLAYWLGSSVIGFLAGWLACAALRIPTVIPIELTADELVARLNEAQRQDALGEGR